MISICEVTVRNFGVLQNQEKIIPGILYFIRPGSSILPALEAQWSATITKTGILNQSCLAAISKKSFSEHNRCILSPFSRFRSWRNRQFYLLDKCMVYG